MYLLLNKRQSWDTKFLKFKNTFNNQTLLGSHTTSVHLCAVHDSVVYYEFKLIKKKKFTDKNEI